MMETTEIERYESRSPVRSTSNESEHRALVEFLSREFGRLQDRACVKLGLYQAQPGSRGQEIRTWHRDEQPEIFEGLSGIEALASLVLELAQREAQSRDTGRHRFELRTVQHLQGSAKHSFFMIVEPDEEFPGIDDQTDIKGQVGQQMRHTEWAIRAMMGMVQSSTASYRDQIRSLSDDNRRMAMDRSRMVAELEASKAEQEERTMAMILAEKADDRKDKVLGKLLPLAPVALAHFMSKGDQPGSGAGALGPLLREFVKTLKPEQVNNLITTLSMEQRILFMQTMEIVTKMDAAENKAEPDANAGAGAQSGSRPPG